MNLPIVVAAYNREIALERLLKSLLKAHYDKSVKLIISIDGGGGAGVQNLAELLDWPHGEKEVILHQENIGLRNHILFCGGLSKQYDGIILLEDDLYVSPWFYQYTVEAAEFYQQSEDVAGIALYAPRFNEAARLPFYPLEDGFDVYFKQLACSWGQLWLRSQWEKFEEWYGQYTADLKEDFTLPYEMRQWPESSWKKYFVKYMIEKNLYFVYPRFSLTTNFGDVGNHHDGTSMYQVPLLYGERKEIRFADFTSSFVKYDAFCEIIPEALVSLCSQFDDADFVVDLYGIKEKHCYIKKYVLTSKPCDSFVQSFGRCLIPIEHNVIDSVSGNDLFFTLAENVVRVDESDFREYIFTKSATLEEQKYFYNISNLHYFLFNKEIDEYKNMYFSGQDKIKLLKETISDLQYKTKKAQSDLNVTQISLANAKNSLANAKKSVELIRKSFSYRIGNKIVYPFSLLKTIVKKAG